MFAALDAGRWADVAAFADEQTAEQFKQAVVQEALEEEKRRAERMHPSDPERIPMKLGGPWYARRYGVTNIAELEARTGRELLARLAKAEAPDGIYARAAMRGGNSISREVLGHVMESDALAHVVYRDTSVFQGNRTSMIKTLPLARVANRWCTQDAGHLANFWHGYPPLDE